MNLRVFSLLPFLTLTAATAAQTSPLSSKKRPLI